MARPPLTRSKRSSQAGLVGLDSLDMPVDPGSFLEKRSYRRRRMTDALRLLPILGLWLFMVPLMWPGAAARLTDTGVSMSSALVYIFAVWTGLIVLCAWLSGAGQQTGDVSPAQRRSGQGADLPAAVTGDRQTGG